MVESFAVHTDHGALRNKGFRVDVFNQPEDDGRFPLLGEYKHHLLFPSRIETGGVDDSHTPMRILVNPLSNFFIFVGNDEELYGLTGTVHHLVENEATNIKSYESIYYFSQSFKTK